MNIYIKNYMEKYFSSDLRKLSCWTAKACLQENYFLFQIVLNCLKIPQLNDIDCLENIINANKRKWLILTRARIASYEHDLRTYFSPKTVIFWVSSELIFL